MKKIAMLFAALLLLANLLAMPVISYAAFDPFGKVCNSETADATVCSDKSNTENPVSGPGGLLSKVGTILAMVTGVASIIIILFASIKYITASGDSNTIGSAKSTITYALIGLVVALSAQGFIAFVVNKL